MLALMKYENGLKFTGLVFENEEVAKEYLKNKNPEAFKLIPVAFYTANGEVKQGLTKQPQCDIL